MDLYGQETEVALLGALRPHLTSGALLDVGAERGGFAHALLAYGYGPAYLVEPASANAEELRRAFAGREDVTVLELAAGATDGEATLYLAEDSEGEPLPAFNTLDSPGEEQDVHWRSAGTVVRRTLGSLAAEGLVPKQAGLLKIDAEGADRDVVAGMGEVECEALMIEHWLDLPDSTGRCPWTLDELQTLLAPHGLERFVYVHHRGSAVRLTSDSADPAVGEYGNLVFMTDALWERSADAVRLVAERADALSDALGQLEDKQGQIELITAAAEERGTDSVNLRAALQRSEQETDRLRSELEQPTPGAASSTSGDDDSAYIADLRGKINELERGVVIGGPIGHTLGSLRFMPRRLREWTRPRLGILGQHPPEPLRLPRRQLRLRVPSDPPAISIVTPSYNQGHFIERTIRSVLDQDYPALEYVVQDGGSDDGTGEVLDAYRSRLTGCFSEPDDGQGDAINRGFAHTDGEIMAWLNSDDVLMPGALAAVARHFARHPETDVVYGQRVLIDEHDRQVGSWILPPHEDWPIELVDFIPQETLFWRRRIWEAAGGQIDPAYRYALDWELLLRFLDANARFVRLPYVLGGFRVHPEQKTTGQLDVGLEEIHQLREQRHGRQISQEEAWERLQPYLRRHVVHHTLHRLMARTPACHTQVAPPRT